MKEQYLAGYVYDWIVCGGYICEVVLLSGSCWSGLYTSLLEFFGAWLPSSFNKVSFLGLGNINAPLDLNIATSFRAQNLPWKLLRSCL